MTRDNVEPSRKDPSTQNHRVLSIAIPQKPLYDRELFTCSLERLEKNLAMKILLTNHFPLEGSASGLYTWNIAKALANRGLDVTVISPEVSKQNSYQNGFEVRNIIFKSEENQDYYDLNFNFPCFTTHPKSDNTFYDLTPTQLEDYLQRFKKLIRQTIEEKNIKIFHGQHLWVLPYLAFEEGLKGIVTCHGTDLMGYQTDPRYKKYADKVVQQAKFIVAISEKTREQIEELFPNCAEKILTIHNGFESEIFKPQKITRREIFTKLNLPETDFLISFTGKLANFKGVDILLEAAKIYEKKINATTVIMGEGDLKGDLINLKNKLELKNVYFLGHQGQQEMATITAGADLAVTPSRKEPYGMVAFEALACETPVVVSDDGWLKEFINEKLGQVFKTEDSSDLAEKILLEIKTDAKKKKGAYAAKYASKNFSWNSVADRLIDLYKKIG